jgi:hypothetical protein
VKTEVSPNQSLLVAVGPESNATIVHAKGEVAIWDLGNVGVNNLLEELQDPEQPEIPLNAASGMWVWEGSITKHISDDNETITEVSYEGNFRRATDQEIDEWLFVSQ